VGAATRPGREGRRRLYQGEVIKENELCRELEGFSMRLLQLFFDDTGADAVGITTATATATRRPARRCARRTSLSECACVYVWPMKLRHRDRCAANETGR
jgi:hypothetical protein